MFRTILVILGILVGIRYSFKGAFYVLLFYLWIAYFRPDAWIWDRWVNDLNLSFLVGIAVVLATVFSKDRFRFGLGQFLMLLFLVHTAISTLNSPAGTDADLWPAWFDFARKIATSLMIVTLVTTAERMRLIFVVIAASLAFEGAKQGWAQLIINPGAVNSNTSPFMGDNNGVAVGMLMLVPILTAITATSKWAAERFTVRFLSIGVIYRAISTYSRGGFLSALALLGHYLLRTKQKFRAVFAVLVVAAVIYPVLPTAFWERMDTIQTAATAEQETELDTSTAGRLHFWRVAVNMGNDNPLLGVGFEAYPWLYNRYDFSGGRFGPRRAVHSAWYGLFAEGGYLGLAIFAAIFVRAFYVNWKARHLAKTRPDMASLAIYGVALEAALLVFVVGGTFVPHQYNEMLWHFLALTIALDHLVRQRVAQPAPTRADVLPAVPKNMPRLGISATVRPM